MRSMEEDIHLDFDAACKCIRNLQVHVVMFGRGYVVLALGNGKGKMERLGIRAHGVIWNQKARC